MTRDFGFWLWYESRELIFGYLNNYRGCHVLCSMSSVESVVSKRHTKKSRGGCFNCKARKIKVSIDSNARSKLILISVELEVLGNSTRLRGLPDAGPLLHIPYKSTAAQHSPPEYRPGHIYGDMPAPCACESKLHVLQSEGFRILLPLSDGGLPGPAVQQRQRVDDEYTPVLTSCMMFPLETHGQC